MKRFAAALLLASAGAAAADGVPRFDALRAAHRASDIVVRDRNGLPLQAVRTDDRVRRGPWVALDEVSPALRTALVLSEDRRFWEHAGVDWSALARSAWANAVNTRTQGGSTLTMQLAGLLDDTLARPAGGRSVGQKLGQIAMARALESRWRKTEILEAYLNHVPLRGELVGIAAASQQLFGRHPGGLDAPQAAVLAALVRAPNAPAADVARRACGVLQAQRLACSGVDIVAAQALARPPGPVAVEPLAPQLARRVAPPGTAADVRTTLDAPLQRLALQTLRRQLAELQGRHVQDGAVVVIDNASGEVRAWVGAASADGVDAVLARRQPGSTLKPFVYGLAFERRLLTPASLLDDTPTELATGADGSGGLYRPQNYDRRFKGYVSARSALGASLNVPAVRVGALLGPDAVFERFEALGLKPSHHAGWHGLALVLGGADVTLLDLANAYRTLANGGRVSAPRWLPGQPAAAPKAVMDPRAAWLVTDVLADNNARVMTFGLDSPLVTRGFAAVKTGTSKDLRDNWCLGFSDRYTVGVWVGNADGTPMHRVSGSTGAAPVWHALMAALHEGRPSRPPAPPPGVERVAVRFEGAAEPPRDEWFIAGTAQAVWRATRPDDEAFGIVAPRDGSLFAIDPDMPPASQRLVFEGADGVWWLDGRRLGEGRRLHWTPWPGRHVLVLRGRDGTPLQQVRFEVRGATARR